MCSRKSFQEGSILSSTRNRRLTRNSYISSLIEHLQQGSPVNQSSRDQPQKPGIQATNESLPVRQPQFAFSRGAYRYVGAGSILLDVQDHQDARPQTWTERQTHSFPAQAPPSASFMAPELIRYLLEVFFNSVHQVFPVLDPSLPWLNADMEFDNALVTTQACVLEMVCGIACHCDDVHSSELKTVASAAYARGLQHMNAATAEPSISTLRVGILLVLYSLFDPISGNISQQLGFVVRLLIDLAGSVDSTQSPNLSTLYYTIYCLENHVCNVLTRPTTLPEPTTPLTFSSEIPLEFLCSLYRLQSRLRRGTLDAASCDAVMLINDGVLETLHPNIVSTLWETRVLLRKTSFVAIRLIQAYSTDGYIATFATPYWVYKASIIIIDAIPTVDNPSRASLMLAYGKSVALLSQWSEKWAAAATLLKSLQCCLQNQHEMIP
ncbi:uncharacterized protein A1O9_09528 [Exophiala aquamarina CBS 119918]|uniref:Transcription factor domain-containing protein n=1 Tax=Exophiala aquamarina CBS 119918 TaxID=1182545 RepID=A0A072P3T4_9EURO|nr:uncharacterized protein A1O9_09528 [Exophiala aquamarina CBS 119918]KEF54362.1 hypothetical protein A1O9_09528 [Exophiala aquamarina CBS 119918]